ncbi:hypothetical protein CV102_04235 [Natronococcus pandeyae]|uniref:Uncharacterized protein n=1 Tax=Natronococcus pandeyae TaxID=2055836 RepID=A0A8J8Q5N4_9EURY|nr:hypothetical protein CV102_04235 [Natronococcus pandeyae]
MFQPAPSGWLLRVRTGRTSTSRVTGFENGTREFATHETCSELRRRIRTTPTSCRDAISRAQSGPSTSTTEQRYAVQFGYGADWRMDGEAFRDLFAVAVGERDVP